MYEKTCTKCRVQQSLDNFNKDKSRKDGFSSWCKKCFSNQCKKWYISNKDYAIRRTKQWQVENAKQCQDNGRQYKKKRIATDIYFKLGLSLRSRLSTAIKNGQKSGSAIKDLGCTIDELKLYLESKFQPGMTWDNWGFKGWHIDHIMPISSFDLSDPEQLKVACRYTNLQPLWAIDNLKKNKY